MIAEIQGISSRRVQQIYKEYLFGNAARVILKGINGNCWTACLGWGGLKQFDSLYFPSQYFENPVISSKTPSLLKYIFSETIFP